MDGKLQQLRKFQLPFVMRKEDIKTTETVKVSQEATVSCMGALVRGFKESANLIAVSKLVSDMLDSQEGGFWLCNIRCKEVENGLIKSEYKGLVLGFERDGMEYEAQICQTKR